MSPEPTVPPFALGRSIIALAVFVTVAALAVVAALVGAEARAQTPAALGGAAVALAAGIAGLLPLHWARHQPASAAPMLAMAGTGLRMVTTLGGAAVLIAGLELAMPAAALWVLGWYLAVMVFEITLLIRYFRSIPTGATGPRRGGGPDGAGGRTPDQ